MHAYRDQYAQVFNGGRNITLIAISRDPVEDLASWARDDEFPFAMASDPDGAVHANYGFRAGRHVFVVGPDGRIAWRAVPFREIDPTAYEELGAALERIAEPVDDGM
jgi:peroxiredoxin